jgi:hypothetical protein
VASGSKLINRNTHMPHIDAMFKATKMSGQSQHWYTRKGQPAHGAGLREARKQDLLPSVTTILSVIAKPGLDNWKIKAAIEASLRLPREEGEDDTTLLARIIEESDKRRNDAAVFGTKIHSACDAINMGGAITDDPVLNPYITHYWNWVIKDVVKVHSSEKVILNEDAGYAGREDLTAELVNLGDCVVDIKTQAVKNNRPNFYPTWGMQLAAYAKCKGIKTGVSIVINSETPEPVYIKVWDNLEPYYKAFVNALELWCFEKNYWPGRKLGEVEVAA